MSPLQEREAAMDDMAEYAQTLRAADESIRALRIRQSEAVARQLAYQAEKADRRRFNGEPMTGFGSLE